MRHLGVIALALTLTACGSEPIHYTDFAIGTTVHLTLFGTDRADLWAQILADLQWLDDTMTIWDRQTPSVLMRANQAAGSPEGYPIPPELEEVIRLGLEVGRASRGALDITVGPLVRAWGIATDHPRVPAAPELAAARALVGLDGVRLEEGRLFLAKPGMVLDLGAVAKGWMADRIAAKLRQAGVERAVIDLGGNIVLLGTKPDGSPWRVGVQDPFQVRGRYLGVLETSATSLVTSGIYERYFDEGGVRYHHILDPTSGFPVVNELAGVTIVHPNSGLADALSTAVFVLGARDGRQLAEAYGAGVIFVTRDRRLWVSPSLREGFRLTATEYTVVEDLP